MPPQTSETLSFHGEFGFSLETDNEACAGLGYATCTTTFEISFGMGTTIDQTQTRSYAKEHSSSAGIGLSFEYTTSDDIEKAGNRSDMFLTPSLNVKFSKSADISFNKASCSAAYKEIVTWSLDSESNVPV